jgi:hypothetical protein
MFIAALITIAKLWKQTRCPATNEWIKKIWYLYIMEFYSATKKMKFCHLQKWTELENIVLSKVRRQNIVSPPSYVDFRPETNAVILLDIGHSLRGECKQEK